MSDADFMKALDNEAYIILLEDKLEEKDKRIKELEGLLRAAKCPNVRCDEGTIFYQVRDPETGEYEVVADEQCQWCAERWMLLGESE